jgi:hypothetical protein
MPRLNSRSQSISQSSRASSRSSEDQAYEDAYETEREQLVAWLQDQKVDYKTVSRDDQDKKKALLAEFCYVLSRGVYAKQHVSDEANACQIYLKLEPAGILGWAHKLTWAGGVASDYSGLREVEFSDVSLVSVGLGTAGFHASRSADRADPACCLSLVLPRTLLLDAPRSLDVEFASAAECEALAYGLSLVISDGHPAQFRGAPKPWMSSLMSCF